MYVLVVKWVVWQRGVFYEYTSTCRCTTQYVTNSLTLVTVVTGETVENVREMKTAVAGTTIEKFQEKYNGIDVYDAVVTVRKNQNGRLTGDASGMLVQDIAEDLPDTTGKLSDQDTLEIVAKAEKVAVEDLQGVTHERKIVLDKKHKAHLVNVITYLDDGVKRPYYMIDLNDGTILKHWEGLTTMPCCDKEKYGTGGNEKIGKIRYGEMPYCMTPTKKDGICYLENKYVRIVDMNYTYDEYIVETASYPCNEEYGDTINGAYSPALDAFFYGTVVGRMMEDWFNTTALDSQIVIRVHYGYMYMNAYWNSVNCTFGDGGYEIYPFTSLDVVAHEVGHGVTEQGSGLEYYDEQGGVNEAFSDIMGETAEAYLMKSDMLTGYDIMKHQDYMREFERPENDYVSIGHVSNMSIYTDPHYSSGIYRRVWWVVVHEYQMDVRKAFEVFLFANRMYWHSSASFFDVSCGLKRAAYDLGADIYPFEVAFVDVGIEYCDVSTHILSLNNNETVENVKVGPAVNPLFHFEAPGWADQLVVIVDGGKHYYDYYDQEMETSNTTVNYTYPSSIPVFITVMKGGWEISDDPCDKSSGNIVGQGFSEVVVGNAAKENFYIRLSLPEDYIVTNTTGFDGPSIEVDLTVGYTCLSSYYADVYIENYYYRDICGASDYYYK